MSSVTRMGAVLAMSFSALAFGVPAGVAATPSTPYDLIQDRSPAPQELGRFGERHAAARDDLNGDGVNDYFIGAPNHDVLAAGASQPYVEDAGRVWAVNGRTREILYAISPPEAQSQAKFGFFIQVLGDVSADGDPDLAVGTQTQDTTAAGDSCAPPTAGCNVNQGKVWVFSGRTGALLYSVIPPPAGQLANAQFGSRLGNAGDINGDGVSDLIAGATGVVTGQGRAYILDGRTGNLLRTLSPPDANSTPGGLSFGLSVQGPGDVDGDGVIDQLVNAAGYNAGAGRLYLFSGSTGAVLSRIDNPTPQAGAFFGFQDAAPLAPGDVNGDGRADIYANGFSQDGPGGRAQGRMWVFDGRASVQSGAGVVLYEPKDPTPHIGGQCCFSLDRTDFNKDGRPDLYVGQSPHHTSARPCPGPDNAPTNCGSNQSGGTYVFDGRDGALLKSLELGPLGQPGGEGNLGSNLGWSAIAPGDLNGDTEPDFVAGATFQDVGENKDEGSSFVFLSRAADAAGPPPGTDGASFPGCRALTANVIRGTAAANRITGTVRADRIFGGTGDDVVDALPADDCVDLGTGNDRGQGGLGNDLVLGGLGNDLVDGSTGNDRLQGDAGDDRVVGNTGNDSMLGGSGKDNLLGGLGNDRLHGQGSTDRIAGSRGRDRINGGSSGDLISAGSSGDRVAGDQGNDRINGNSGNDVLKGNSGHDRITGLTGADRIAGGSGNDRINSRDGRRDRVDCGRGRDRVLADRFDVIARTCERVSRRR